MNGRPLLTKVVVALTAVLLWQQVFSAPAPVKADTPPPGYIDCGLGFVCGGSNPNIPPSGNIEVTGPEDRIVQDTTFDINDPNDISAAAAWGPLELEAEGSVAMLHGVAVDSRLTDFGRSDIRAFMFSRLLDIAHKSAGSRTAMEQTAFDKFESLIKQRHILAAQKAVDEYNRWANSPCSYTWPTVFASATPYLSGGVLLVCSDHDPNTNPPSPSEDVFAAMGAAMAFSDLATDPNASSIAGSTGESLLELAALGTGAEALATSAELAAVGGSAVGEATAGATGIAAATLANPAVAAITAEAIANPAVAAVEIANPAVAAVDIVNPAVVIPEAASAVSALSVAAVVAIAIFALVTIAIQTWQLVEQLSIPQKLNQKLVDAQAETPDINAMTQDPANLLQLLMIFTNETLPDYPDQRPTSVDGHSAADPDFAPSLHIPGLGQPIDIPLPVANTINPVDWDGIHHTVYLANGWFVDQPVGASPHYSLSIEYVNWAGEHWRASVAGDSFIQTRDGFPDDSFDSPAIDYVDSSGLLHVERHSNRPPTITIQSDATGVIHEGDTVHFHADVSDPDDALPGGDPTTVNWLVEPVSRESSPITIVDGQSSLDRCYTQPAGPSSLDGLVGLDSDCPWDSFTGPDLAYAYNDNNVSNQPVLHVRAIVTDSHGASASQILVLNVASVDPTLALDAPTHSVLDGDTVTISGSFNDLGNDQETVTIDWGDGSTTGKAYPCAWVDFAHNPLGLTQCIFGAQSAGHPTTFSLDHVYHLASGESSSHYVATVTVTDDDFASDSDTATVDVGQRHGQPSLYPVGHDFGTVAVGQSAAYAFALNNIGNGDLDVTGFHIAGTGASSFSVGTQNCTGSPLAGGGACVVWVNFTPTTNGLRSASLVVDAEVAGTPESTPLTGFGTQHGTITIVQDSVPNNGANFKFDRSGPTGTVTFKLDDDSNHLLPNTKLASNLPAGSYTITQHDVAHWALTSLNCDSPAATDLVAGTATFDLADGENITCTYQDSLRRPDGQLSKNAAGPFIGDNTYLGKPGSRQSLTRTVHAGKSVSYWLRMQNDSKSTDQLSLAAAQTVTTFTVGYFVGATDVTAAVLAGTYVTPDLAPGEYATVQVVFTAAPSTPYLSTASTLLTVASASLPSVHDVLRAGVLRN